MLASISQDGLLCRGRGLPKAARVRVVSNGSSLQNGYMHRSYMENNVFNGALGRAEGKKDSLAASTSANFDVSEAKRLAVCARNLLWYNVCI